MNKINLTKEELDDEIFEIKKWVVSILYLLEINKNTLDDETIKTLKKATRKLIKILYDLGDPKIKRKILGQLVMVDPTTKRGFRKVDRKR